VRSPIRVLITQPLVAATVLAVERTLATAAVRGVGAQEVRACGKVDRGGPLLIRPRQRPRDHLRQRGTRQPLPFSE
jgi:hypothetical protein